MKKTNRKGLIITSYILLFVVTFVLSALICVKVTGGLPNKLIKTVWNDDVGTCYTNLPYENEGNHKYDLYVPTKANQTTNLILFIHGGSFNSGCKEDGEDWCKYYAVKSGCITASIDYSLQKKGVDANLNKLNEQVKNSVSAIKSKCSELGYSVNAMATCGVSAGGTLAMNYAYKCAKTSAIPVKFVFQLSGPSDFEPDDWSLLKKVNKIKTDAEFLKWMTGVDITDEMISNGEYTKYVDAISPARLINEDSVPSLIGYGLRDHAVPSTSRTLLVKALQDNGVKHDYIEFPHSNHGMYADLDKLQEFLDKSLEYCSTYFDYQANI